MKALLLTAYKKLEVTKVPEPEMAADEVIVRIAACGICGSDIHGYDGSSGRRIPPLIMGHEAAGVIERVGDQVEGYRISDRVTFDSTVFCGDCDYCAKGDINLCEDRMVLGVSCDEYRRDGAFAEFVNIPARILHRVPDALPLEHAAMVEPVSVAVHAVSRSALGEDNSVLVVGAGMIGLLVVQVLRHHGCSPIVAVDLSDDRLKLASSFGATHTCNPSEVDAASLIGELTNGEGLDSSFEVVGSTPTVQLAIEAVRKGGDVTLIGNLAPIVDFPLQSVVTRELTLHGSCASRGEYPECIELMASGAIDVAPLISAEVSLEEGPELFAKLYAGSPSTMKVLIKP